MTGDAYISGDAEARLADIGIVLGTYREPRSQYLPAIVTGNLIYFSGQLSAMEYDGTVEGITGRLATDSDIGHGRAAARLCAIGLLERARLALGSLDRVQRIIRLVGYINTAPGFTSQHLVLDGCSEVLITALGERGRHTRLAIGIGGLSFDTTVEVECIMEIAS